MLILCELSFQGIQLELVSKKFFPSEKACSLLDDNKKKKAFVICL